MRRRRLLPEAGRALVLPRRNLAIVLICLVICLVRYLVTSDYSMPLALRDGYKFAARH
jgi:hypothetical protein